MMIGGGAAAWTGLARSWEWCDRYEEVEDAVEREETLEASSW